MNTIIGHFPILLGDGTAVDIVPAMQKVVEYALALDGKNIRWIPLVTGDKALEATGARLPKEVLDVIRKNPVAIKAPMNTPTDDSDTSPNVMLRKALNLHACVRPIKYYQGMNAAVKNYQGTDIVIFRENVEDLYSGVEFKVFDRETVDLINTINTLRPNNQIPMDSGLSIKFTSVEGTRRIMNSALEYAKEHGRKKIAVVTKRNIMKATDLLFAQTCEQLFEEKKSEYPGITLESVWLIDNTTQKLVSIPNKFDMIVTLNLYGDILSDLCGGIVGGENGIGLLPGANIGDKCAIFEATHGTWPTAAGKNIASPIALILSAKMMLEYIGEQWFADLIESAVENVLLDGRYETLGTKETAEYMCKYMHKKRFANI
mgnify:FL=1